MDDTTDEEDEEEAEEEEGGLLPHFSSCIFSSCLTACGTAAPVGCCCWSTVAPNTLIASLFNAHTPRTNACRIRSSASALSLSCIRTVSSSALISSFSRLTSSAFSRTADSRAVLNCCCQCCTSASRRCCRAFDRHCPNTQCCSWCVRCRCTRCSEVCESIIDCRQWPNEWTSRLVRCWRVRCAM